MINLKTAGLKITLLTFSMVSVMACKKIFLKPQPVVQENTANKREVPAGKINSRKSEIISKNELSYFDKTLFVKNEEKGRLYSVYFKTKEKER